MSPRWITPLLALLTLTTPALAQEVVPVGGGKGSYASKPPADAGKGATEMLNRKFPLVAEAAAPDRPIPTNQYWTWLLNGKASGQIWSYPFRVDITDTGLQVFYPQRWNDKGTDPLCDNPLKIESPGKFPNLQVKNWGDWSLCFRLPQTPDKFLDITTAQGMPFVWIESQGLPLTLKVAKDAQFLDSRGTPLSFPATVDQLTVSSAGRLCGVFVPPGTRLDRSADQLTLNSPPGKSFLIIAALKDPKDLATFAKYAYSIPRDTRMDWSYDPKSGAVKTTWTIKTEPLIASAPDQVLQGWLPHHYRGATPAFKLDGPEYLTPRGTMKTAAGNKFQLTYSFDGFLPVLPAPVKTTAPNPFDPARMAGYLDAVAKKSNYGDDSYWGGKDLLRPAQHMLFAKQLNDPSADRLRDNARTALADWLTYSPGEKAHYFARYENWHALIGFKGSYDSEKFNDQHFHYGYFTNAAAMLATEDPAFLKDYGDMLRLVAREYANWDRKDTRTPFLRTFDIWAGHSWAGGLGSPGGNNQESSSEAMQSWAGLYLLGTMLDDPAMTAAGAMGYAIESKAVMEYWFNIHADNLPPKYGHPTVGILWSGGNAYGTYFTGDPGWVFGIQCLPVTPALEYLAIDPAFAAQSFKTALANRKAKEGSDDPGKMGDLGNVLLAHASKFDPDYVCQQMDALWESKNDIARKHTDAGTIYYYAHAYRALGTRDYAYHLTTPLAAAYTHPTTKLTTYTAYNPKNEPLTVQVQKGEAPIGTFTAPPHQLTTTTKLTPSR